MKHNRYTAIASLVFTLIPFVSTLISTYIDLPLVQETSYKVIMAVLFAIAWIMLGYIVNEIPDETLRKLKLMEDASKKVRAYWLIEYEKNPILACSILEIRDDCSSSTTSKLRDFSIDLSELHGLGINNMQFDGNKRLTQIHAKGSEGHSFTRFEFNYHEQFNIIRINDYDKAAPSKMCGTCRKVTPEMVRSAEISDNEKSIKRMLASFALLQESILALLLYALNNQQTDFSKEVLQAYNNRKFSEATTNIHIFSESVPTPTDTTAKDPLSKEQFGDASIGKSEKESIKK